MTTPIDREEVLYQLERLALEAQLTNEHDAEIIKDCMATIVNLVPVLTPPNEPLTLEELREMDGKPVWCKYIGDTTFASRWMIVDCEMNKCSSGEWELPFEDDPDDAYGRTWIAYRCPPEGEDNE